jgi:hypothetical protein
VKNSNSQNSPKVIYNKINSMTTYSTQEAHYNNILKPIRDQFIIWLHNHGYTITQIENLTDEQVYEIIRKI